MIFVFKTSLQSQEQVQNLKPHLDAILPKVSWNFDLDDCDNILRVVSDTDVVLPIINLLRAQQFTCEELI